MEAKSCHCKSATICAGKANGIADVTPISSSDPSSKEFSAIISNSVTPKGEYFDSYAHYGTHEYMLKDHIRTNAYKEAVMQNAELFRGKVVLDVGCGTGILSMFAAKAGAKKVYAVDFSNMVFSAQKIVKDNKLDDVITVLHSKVEELILPDGVEKVDVIISEWMGYCLLYEAMIDSVIYARDKWLAPGGIMYPDRATMFICAIQDRDGKQDKIDWWKNVYGFNMGEIRNHALSETQVDTVNGEKVCTNHVIIFDIDMQTVKTADEAFKSDFTLVAKRDDSIHALLVWFTVDFNKGHHPVRLSTAPEEGSTHWKQTIFYLDEPISIKNGETLRGTFTCIPGGINNRDPDFEISIDFSGANSCCQVKRLYKGDYSTRHA